MSKNDKKKREETLEEPLERPKIEVASRFGMLYAVLFFIGTSAFCMLGILASMNLELPWSLYYSGIGIGAFLFGIRPLWQKLIDYPTQRRSFAFISKNKHQLKLEESRRWLKDVEAQEIYYNRLEIKRFPDCFVSEDVIPPSMKKSINDPSSLLLNIGILIVILIVEGLIIANFFYRLVDNGIKGIGAFLFFGIFLIIQSRDIYRTVRNYYRTYQDWYDKEYFQLLSERGRCLATLKEDPTNNEAQSCLNVVSQLITEMEKAGRTPLPSIRRLIVPAMGVGVFLVQFLF